MELYVSIASQKAGTEYPTRHQLNGQTRPLVVGHRFSEVQAKTHLTGRHHKKLNLSGSN
jgi:hypothetical protein